MKIILASDNSFLLEYGYKATGISKSAMHIGYVTTASKGARTNRNQSYRQELIDAGYVLHEFDIENKTKNEILSFFEDKNIIQVEGGNTFYLLRAIRETGFDVVLDQLLKQGKVYIGVSAGSYVMCPSIVVADWNDESVSRYSVSDFGALGYTPFVLKAHYTDEQEQKMRDNLQSLKYPLRILRDGQGILVEDGTCTFLGGEEVKIN